MINNNIIHDKIGISMQKLLGDINKLINRSFIKKTDVQKRADGYFAIVLSDRSRKQVAKYKKKEHTVTRSHHVTLAYAPNVIVAKTFSKFLNKRITLRTRSLYGNNNIFAFTVKIDGDLKSENNHAHITISHNKETQAVESNNLIEGGQKNFIKNIEIPLEGTVQFIPTKKDFNLNAFIGSESTSIPNFEKMKKQRAKQLENNMKRK